MNNSAEKTQFEKFYRGWAGFQSMWVGEEGLVFKVARVVDVAGSVRLARERIARLNLPLEVRDCGPGAKTFMVKEIRHD